MGQWRNCGFGMDLEGPAIDDHPLLRKHVDGALSTVPLMAAAPVHISTSLMNDAPWSSAASSTEQPKVDPTPMVNSQKPDLLIKFQVSDQLKKFMVQPEKDSCRLFCWVFLSCALGVLFLFFFFGGCILCPRRSWPSRLSRCQLNQLPGLS